ncbi:uroporphyrinogen-III C-methyltransferase [Paucibacter sp. TC2R-5]|uniref:uroporphyrinogen-III C-methyltransferase n=1 Tax=Paucibacter sp. TC2R-5 TaxID=2893555 RepID=UPI0021E3D217|nr:uroporphyrinogen-III C-methyltransferase [Paucibacter sp. TC2R-5]MCV2358861.1 uroporphyrinogen-III C-methyltransferase [Paucibacter sp. TC2R-5]
MSILDEPLYFGPLSRAVPRAPAHQPTVNTAAPALVTLVGAGPGDPDLLTVKAARAIAQAQLVLYDHLVSKEVLRLLPPSAELIYVGKQSGQHALPQEGIIDLMLRLAQSGRPVLRLKGGDPYIFGRGGEEAQALAAAGVPCQTIPGISAAQGAGACAGIPLTHRDHARSLVFATGHLCAAQATQPSGAPPTVDLDWEMLARPRQTVVIYMGLGALPIICEQLIAHGMAPDMPAALIENASLPEQRCVSGNLQSLPSLALLHAVKAPALIMIGTVVSLRSELAAGLAYAHAHQQAAVTRS